MHLCGLRLLRSAFYTPPAAGIALQVAFRFGVADEVTVTATPHGKDAGSVSYVMGSSHVSGAPIWVRCETAGMPQTPSLGSLHFHLWHGDQLLGLATLPVPTAGLPDFRSASSCLLSQDVEICSLHAGSVVGHMRIALHAGPASILKAQPPHPASLPALHIQAEPREAKPQESRGQQLQDSPTRLDQHTASPKGEAPQEAVPLRSAGVQEEEIANGGKARPGTAWDETASCLWLVAAGISADDVLTEARRPHKPGFATYAFQCVSGAVELEELCEGLLRAVDGLTPRQAALLASYAKCGLRMVSADLWRGFVLEVTARAEAALDLLQQEVGSEVLGQLAEQLAALGSDARLRHTEFAALLAHRTQKGPRWGLMEELLRLLDSRSAGALPARPLAKLIARRAEMLRKAEPECPEKCKPGNDTEAFHFRIPSLSAARQLLSAFFCLLTAGEVGILEAASCLDQAARQVSTRQPALWCSSAPIEDVILAGILEIDKQGIHQVVLAWQALRLPTSASAAVSGLRSLAHVEGAELRVHEANIREALVLGESLVHRDLMAQTLGSRLCRACFEIVDCKSPRRSRASKLQVLEKSQSRTAGSREEDFFTALLSAGIGPEELRSRLRTSCATLGEGGRFIRLDQLPCFASKFSCRFSDVRLPSKRI